VSNTTSTTAHPLVTIAIPTFNRAATTMPRTLASALAQTYFPLEIIVSDNCSEDGTRAYLETIKDCRVRTIRQPRNIGFNNNLNYCIDHARGDYVLLLHDDDLIDPDFVAACIDAAGGRVDYGLIRTGMRMIDSSDRVLFERPNRTTGDTLADLMRAWFDNRTSQYCCNTLYNTRALREAGGFHSRHDRFQDALAQVKVAASHGCAHVRDAKASWRRHDQNLGSLTRTSLRDWCEDSLEVLNAIRDLAGPDGPALYTRGKQFFCTLNYTYIARSAPLHRKLLDYLLVARHFGFASSPLAHFVRHHVRPELRAAKKRLTARTSQAS
jgi:glycosyltransferase involved in cell wall biosynthesis